MESNECAFSGAADPERQTTCLDIDDDARDHEPSYSQLTAHRGVHASGDLFEARLADWRSTGNIDNNTLTTAVKLTNVTSFVFEPVGIREHGENEVDSEELGDIAKAAEIVSTYTAMKVFTRLQFTNTKNGVPILPTCVQIQIRMLGYLPLDDISITNICTVQLVPSNENDDFELLEAYKSCRSASACSFDDSFGDILFKSGYRLEDELEDFTGACRVLDETHNLTGEQKNESTKFSIWVKEF
ncbi:hypothetical protein BWQ96_10006 [Gracilariopsis chorda]|uniref:Uncharacterized protein n=1 Tax=Gracilariopsis chorda TaxID=448386 RepID=A0A2V3IDY1_9FLOR|nr:hypothetical protein BWQ96_10006 [Gracilariopsis chorda]|eukprot:PXF40286.1 hypothetical protein BWQ96_10006 [Gracilariopsis chorda]